MRFIAYFSHAHEAAMLLHSRSVRVTAWGVLAILFIGIFGLPLLMVFLSSIAGQWNGIFPTGLTLHHYVTAFHGATARHLQTSVITAAGASSLALVIGTWGALANRGRKRAVSRVVDGLFMIPIAVPSVSVGLGLLVAFSRPPVLLNGTAYIVLAAHTVIVVAFAYGTVSSGLARLSSDQELVAASLGARPGYVLWRVTLPLLRPQLIAAASLSFALSMGELGATIMLYPPGWVTLPVGIFALSDRGSVSEASALTVLLLAMTGAGLSLLSLARSRAPASH